MAQLTLKPPFYDYYAKKRADGKSRREALIANSRKLVHVVYAVLSTTSGSRETPAYCVLNDSI